MVELRICASLLFVLLIIVLGIVVFPVVWPGWEALSLVWPFVLSLIGLLVALSKRSFVRYVRVRQA
ncbi:hypothetical protein ADK55_33355 [Streptomyces sp. WM4235]|uniref:hypothetical protein n=1 Tax=Streptomyces sp. WM4235 TaxID=1415551 RepID=UPI0006B03DA2|nr:hypothetical protein [Streptomyces sp. WM4235]KOU39409.1 hypothetical protein ADK55_33355 [Streptomyces sp. WM4235]